MSKIKITPRLTELKPSSGSLYGRDYFVRIDLHYSHVDSPKISESFIEIAYNVAAGDIAHLTFLYPESDFPPVDIDQFEQKFTEYFRLAYRYFALGIIPPVPQTQDPFMSLAFVVSEQQR
jgi:hypothetical protein